MRVVIAAALLLVSAFPGFAQLTSDQKTTDFLALVASYDRTYGPYFWKIQAFDYDMLQIQPWLAQVNAAQSDLEFYDVCVRYVAALHDYHSDFSLPALYEALLPFTVDIYDGKVLVDTIDRTVLDAKTYPFQIGDELVSVDGVSVADWIQELLPYSILGYGNPTAAARQASAAILDRLQQYYPFAENTQAGDQSTVVIRSQGKLVTYRITWSAMGTPLTDDGPFPTRRSLPLL